MNSLRHLCLIGLTLTMTPAHAITLQELVATEGPPRLFVATKGAEMPTHDQSNNFNAGDRALLLSGRQLTDITGVSTILVNDAGVVRPIAEVKSLLVFFNRNELTRIPEEVGGMHNVRFFYAEHNRLSSLPEVFTRMRALEGVYFGDCQFTAIPPFVFTMTRLKKLQFSGNRIAELPEAIGRLTELRHLNVSRNRIASVPEGIARLMKLRVCDLSDNPITSLPEAFGAVPIVNQLRVRNCPISTLPQGFAAMRATIDITGTRIDPATLPAELRAKIDTEKPEGSKDWDKITVKPRRKDK